MSCETFEPLLVDYATGTLPDLPRARLLEHLRECAACAAVVRDYDSLHQRLARLGHSLDLIEPPFVLAPMEKASEKRHLSIPRPSAAPTTADKLMIGPSRPADFTRADLTGVYISFPFCQQKCT